jgi:hypothetical protein
VVDTAGEIQLFHRFHHDVDDGLNDGTNQLWALQGGSSMAQAVSIRPDQLSLKQKSYAIEWTTMTAWNSTEDILADVNIRVNKHAPQAARVGRPPMSGRSAKALASATKTKRQVPTARGRKRRLGPIDYASKACQDDVEDLEIEEPQLAPMFPIPAFVAATLMEGYESDPIELCWQTIEEIRKRASADGNAVDTLRLGEVASYVPRWLFSTAVNVRLAANSSTPFGVSNRSVCHLRMDEWTQEVHRRHLAVRARSILGGTRQRDSTGEPRTRSGIC